MCLARERQPSLRCLQHRLRGRHALSGRRLRSHLFRGLRGVWRALRTPRGRQRELRRMRDRVRRGLRVSRRWLPVPRGERELRRRVRGSAAERAPLWCVRSAMRAPAGVPRRAVRMRVGHRALRVGGELLLHRCAYGPDRVRRVRARVSCCGRSMRERRVRVPAELPLLRGAQRVSEPERDPRAARGVRAGGDQRRRGCRRGMTGAPWCACTARGPTGGGCSALEPSPV